MAVREALVKVEEYNAAMELPFSGLLAIQALLVPDASTRPDVARSELSACSQLCRLAELSLSAGRDVEAARDNVHLYSALIRIFHTPDEKEQYRIKFAEIRNTLETLLKEAPTKATGYSFSKERLREMADEFRRLADRIKVEIPRDTYLASLTNATRPGPVTRGR